MAAEWIQVQEKKFFLDKILYTTRLFKNLQKVRQNIIFYSTTTSLLRNKKKFQLFLVYKFGSQKKFANYNRNKQFPPK